MSSYQQQNSVQSPQVFLGSGNAAPTKLLPEGYAKVIKGEIHNVLSVMRADPRYAPPSRFSSNLILDPTSSSNGTTAAPTATTGQHPLIASLRDLNDYLTRWELINKQQSKSSQQQINVHRDTSTSSSRQHQVESAKTTRKSTSTSEITTSLDALTYLSPFCTAISSHDISAPITGAALSAIHKFLLYGFLDPSVVNDAKEGITVVARAIRHCSFEENIVSNNNNNRIGGGNGSGGGNGRRGESFFGKRGKGKGNYDQDVMIPSSSMHSTRTTQSHRSTRSHKTQQNGYNHQQKTLLQVTDEEVVLKLLSLSSLVIRCCCDNSPSLGVNGVSTANNRESRFLLSSNDMVGIFDTCLHVATRVSDCASGLLQSAAADCLGGIVVVVFGSSASTSVPEIMERQISSTSQYLDVDGYGDNDDSSSVGSDDLWGDSDPGQEILDMNTEVIVHHYKPTSVKEQSNTIHVEEEKNSNLDNVVTTTGKTTTQANSNITDLPCPSSSVSISSNEHSLPINERPKLNKTPAIVTIMSRLASLVNPFTNSHQTCAKALQLINIALETVPSPDHLSKFPQLLNILKNTVCKHLLYLSTTSDLVILSQALRVIFNLFNSIKHHLKVQLEVFLTSVHLRILQENDSHEPNASSPSSVPTPTRKVNSNFTPEQRELALESLLEFCNEPALMQDLYVNYDCDVQCTNLFETICRVLARNATGSSRLPDDDVNKSKQPNSENNTEKGSGSMPTTDENSVSPPSINTDVVANDENSEYQQPLNCLNKLACEGILAVIDSIARRCETSTRKATISDYLASIDNTNPTSSSGELSVDESGSICSFTETNTTTDGSVTSIASPPSSSGSETLEWLENARDQTSKVFSERKRKKHKLAVITKKFNEKPTGKDWIREGEKSNIFPQPATPRAVAQFLYSTPNLDKSQIGIYLSKGPKEKYPFQDDVLKEFLALFDFRELTFADALRQFLKRFRMPGEAQCIERLMEAFATELFDQQNVESSASSNENTQKDNIESSFSPEEMLSLPVTHETPVVENDRDESAPCSKEIIDKAEKKEEDLQQKRPNLFKNSDSVFILAFSTIMLNTDLHNPTIKDERRMTLEQFIRNNRGINFGHDFPPEFMSDLYNQIKENEIQVQRGLSDLITDNSEYNFDGLLTSKSTEGFTPFFTSHDQTHSTSKQPGVHECDMFITIAPCALHAMTSIFVRSSDDSLVVKLLTGFKQMAKICVFFELEDTFNDLIGTLLEYGRDFVSSTLSLSYCGYDVDEVSGMNKQGKVTPTVQLKNELDNDEVSWSTDRTTTVPTALLASNSRSLHPIAQYSHLENDLLEGSANHKGFLCLDCAFSLVSEYQYAVREAWPSLLECIFALRDAGALPANFSELDDFANSLGKILPPSLFALKSRRRAHRHMLSMFSDGDDVPKSQQGSFWSFSSFFSHPEENQSNVDDAELDVTDLLREDLIDSVGIDPKLANSSFSKDLLSVSEATNIDKVLIGKRDRNLAMQILRIYVDTAFREMYIRPCNTDEALPQTAPSSETKILEHHSVFSLELAARSLFSNGEHALELFPIFMSKFRESLATFKDESSEDQLENAFLIERMIVTILRSCIHFIDRSDMRPSLLESLELILQLPSSFLQHVMDRVACGTAIILRCSYLQLSKVDEWAIIGALLDSCAHYEAGRKFIFDGIASCVDDGFPVPYINEKSDEVQADGCVSKTIAYEGASLFARILLKFVFGSYDSDVSFSVPSIHRLERVYWYLHNLTIENDSQNQKIPDEDLWGSICSAFYSVCLCDSPESAVYAIECLERLIFSTEAEHVSDSGWLSLLESMTSKQPLISYELPRARALHLMCKCLLWTLPVLMKKGGNEDALTEVVNQIAQHAEDNIRARLVAPLFESTVETLTNTANVMTMPEFGGGSPKIKEFAEVLIFELEKAGAAGFITRNIAATTKKRNDTPSIEQG